MGIVRTVLKGAATVAGGIIGGPLGAAAGGAIAGVATKALSKKKGKVAAPAVPLPQITPRRPSAASEALAGRRGTAANQRTGSSGAESTAKGKNRLMGLN